MKKRALLAGSLLIAAVIAMAASVGDASPKLKAFADKMGTAKAFSAKYTVQVLQGDAKDYSVYFEKPDKARIDAPGSLTVADGKFITVLDKAENTYYKKAQTEEDLMALFSDTEVGIWKTFFKPEAVANFAASKDAGTKTLGGKPMNVVNVQVDKKGELNLKLFTDTADNTLKQGVITSGSGDTAKSSVVIVTESGFEANSALVAFAAPAGAKELSADQMVAGKWLTNFEEAQKLAKQFNKGLIVDFYADW